MSAQRGTPIRVDGHLAADQRSLLTYHRRVGGSGAPGTPPPIVNGRAIA